MHGIPRNDHAIWNNDLYELLPDYRGVEVLIGHLTHSASWDSPTGHISLSLSGERHSKLLLDCRSKDFRNRKEETRCTILRSTVPTGRSLHVDSRGPGIAPLVGIWQSQSIERGRP